MLFEKWTDRSNLKNWGSKRENVLNYKKLYLLQYFDNASCHFQAKINLKKQTRYIVLQVQKILE